MNKKIKSEGEEIRVEMQPALDMVIEFRNV
jgi:hypothetical protein